MRFAYDFGASTLSIALVVLSGLFVIVFAALQIRSVFAPLDAQARFGEGALVAKLTSFDGTARRSVKGVLLVFAVALAFFALARPQFGRGQKLIPATSLDVVIVLDYSKSMYARDVAPNRIARAKAEVARLIQRLPGARFAAVAFAGEPLAFPLTSDGAAISQFFRQLDPNDMPIGGTATARALQAARDLLARDPKAKEHARVIVLVTDGEDLEGDPVAVAQACKQEGTRVDVVQIGGRAPEIIPDVAADGRIVGVRHDEYGKPLTTELSADGEAQLARIAQETGGSIVRAEQGQTGIDKVAVALSKMMHEELSERMETDYADEYAWFLGAAVLLLVVDGLLGEAPRRRWRKLGQLPSTAESTRRAERTGRAERAERAARTTRTEGGRA